MNGSTFHCAIIMDGNGRWAEARGLPRIAGHRRGADAVRVAIETAPELGITDLTLYAFSSDNWKRPPAEVSALMTLLAGTSTSRRQIALAKEFASQSSAAETGSPHPCVTASSRPNC